MSLPSRRNRFAHWSIAPFLLLLAGSIQAQTTPFEAMLVSDAGDYIGGGETFHFVSSPAGEVIQPAPDGARVQFTWALNGFWWFQFSGPGGARLQSGAYENAQRSPEPGMPGLDISGQGNGCNRVEGRFEVHDVAYAADGSVERLAIDAVQYCEGSKRALRAYLRYGNTSVPIFVPRTSANAGPDQTLLPGALVTLNGTQSTAQAGGPLSYSWTQIAGDPVALSSASSATPTFSAPTPVAEWQVLRWRLEVQDAQGRRAQDTVSIIVSESSTPRSEFRVMSELTGAPVTRQEVLDTSRLLIDRNFHNGIFLQYDFLSSAGQLRLQLAGPQGAELEVGNFPIAYRYPFFAPSAKAGLDVILGLGCGQSFGNFIVHDVAYSPGGEIERLALDYSNYCVDLAVIGGELLEDHGYIRINSVVPITSRAPTASAGVDQIFEPLDGVRLDASASTGGASNIVRYEWEQLSGPAVQLAGGGTSAPQFTAPDVPPQGANLEFRLTVTNSAGFSSTDSVLIHVRGAEDPWSIAYLEPQGYDFPTGGSPLWLDEAYGHFSIEQYELGGRENVSVTYDDITFSNFRLIAPAGQQLTTGVYPDADTIRDDKPGFSFSSDGKGCNQSVGSMTIHQIERDANGRVIRLAVDFKYRCDYGALVRGVLRVNSAVPVVAPELLVSAGATQQSVGGDVVRLDAGQTHPGAGTITSYSWRQLSGPAVTLTSTSNVVANFTAPASGGVLEFEVTVTTSDGRSGTSIVRIEVAASGTPRSLLVIDADPDEAITLGESLRIDLASGAQFRNDTGHGFDVLVYSPHNFTLRLWAPFEEQLAVGFVYEGTRPFGTPGREPTNFPGLTFTMDSQTCRLPRGRFVIRELVRDPSGQITSLAVDFQQACDPSHAYIRAALRINSGVPVRSLEPMASAGLDLKILSGRPMTLDGRASTGGIEGATLYQWQQISGPPVVFSGSTASTPFAVADVPSLSGSEAEAVFSLTVTNALGASATDTVTVKVLPEDAPITEMLISRYNPATRRTTYDWFLDVNNSFPTLYTPSSAVTVMFRYDLGLYGTFEVPSSDFRLTPGIYRASLSDLRFRAQHDAELSCFEMEGVVRIVSAEYEGDTLRGLAFDFDVNCLNAFGYVGAIRYNSVDRIELGRPVTNAGTDLTANEGATVTLDGRKSLVVGVPVQELTWSQVSGPTVSLQTVSSGVVSFVAPQVSSATALEFRVRVSGNGDFAEDTLTVTVNDVAPPPPPPPPPPPSPSTPPGNGGGGGSLDALTLMSLLVLLTAVRRRRVSPLHHGSHHGAFRRAQEVIQVSQIHG